MMDFQTPPPVADYMASLPLRLSPPLKGLEPTPGEGNLVAAIKRRCPNAKVSSPTEFFDLVPSMFNGELIYPRFDYIIMNPPFSPMIQGWKFLKHCMEMSDNIVCLLPWFIPLNSRPRLRIIQKFGLVSITDLPRKTFPGTRIQCCVLEMVKDYTGQTIFKTFEF